MDQISEEFGGEVRRFQLRFGELLDLETQTGVGFGELYQRIARTRWYAKDLRAVIKFGLIGGGMAPADADALARSRFEDYPLQRSVGLALKLLLATMEGIPKDETVPTPKGPAQPFNQGKLFESFVKAGIAPDDVRKMRYRDFVVLTRAASGGGVQPPSEEEFRDMVRRLAPHAESFADVPTD